MRKYFITNERRIKDSNSQGEIMGLILDYDGDIKDKYIVNENIKNQEDLVPLKSIFCGSYINISGITDKINCTVTTKIPEVFNWAYEVKKDNGSESIDKKEKKKSKMLEVFKIINSIEKIDGVKFIKQLF